MTEPSEDKYERMAIEVIKELLNPEPHPFQKEWSPDHSMTSEQLMKRIADKLRNQGELLDDAEKVVTLLSTQLINASYALDIPSRFKESFNDGQKKARDFLTKLRKDGR